MKLHLVIGGAGCGKSTMLMQQLQAALASGQRVRTLVPEQFAFTYDKKLYASLGAAAFNRVMTGSFRGITAEILEAQANGTHDAADDVTKTIVLHRVLHRLGNAHALRFYDTQAVRPGFLPEMQKQLTELMQSGNTPAQLADAATATEGVLSEKTLDLARIYADYLEELAKHGLRDTMCDLAMAAAYADGTSFLRGETLFLDEFESFTGDQFAMLEVMLRDADAVWIALRTDDPDAPDYSRFDAVNATCRQLKRLAGELVCPMEVHLLTGQHRFESPSLAHLSRYVFTDSRPAYDGAAAVTVTEARDVTLEAEYTAAQIRDLLYRGKAQCRDIMVVTHDLERYGFLLEAAFARYEIPYFMDLRRSVLHTAVMKLPIALLQLAEKTSTEHILLYLKTQLSPLHPAAAADLENYAYTWDIDGVQWEQPFVTETDPSGIMEEMRKQVMEPVMKLRRPDASTDGAALCAALYQCMDEAGIPMRVGGLAAHLHEQGDISGARALRKLWNRFTELLDTMHTALKGDIVTFSQLSDLLSTVLRQNQIPVPPQTLDAVTVQTAAAARYDAPKIVFVLGVIEGEFPANIQTGGLFSENERTALEKQGVHLARSVRDLCADERLIVYKTLSAPSHRLYLSYPLAEENGKRLLPAAVLGQIRQLLPKRTMQYADRMGAAFYVTTKSAAYYSFVQDYLLDRTEAETVKAMLAQNPEDNLRLERLRRTADPARLRVDDSQKMLELTGNAMRLSATRIQNLMECPFKGFCANGLRLYVRRKNDFNELSVGNLVHYCMERLFTEYPTREAFLALSEDALRRHAEACAADYLRMEFGGDTNRSPRFLQNYRAVTEKMLALLRHTQAEMAQSSFAPDACELVIGKLGEEQGTAPFTLQLSNGMMVYLNGKVDRVDLCEENGQTYLRVVDYKTGVKQYHPADLYYGLNLQMLLYLFALLDDDANYPQVQPAGVLYMPSGAPTADRSRDDMQSVAAYFNSHFRMSGTVLCDRGVLSAMEQNVAGVYIPAKLAAGDTGTGAPLLTDDSQVFTQTQLQNLRKYIEDIIKTAAESYLQGEVAPSPMQPKSSISFYTDACRYCDFSGICGAGITNAITPRYPEKEKTVLAAMEDIMNGKTADGEEDAT